MFTNPGLLKLPVEQIYAGGESRARNLHIQTLFRMIGFGENIGLSAWDEKHWLRPELIEQPELLQVKLTLTIENKEENGLVEKLVEKLGKKLGKNSIVIIELIVSNPNITYVEIAEALSVSTIPLPVGITRVRSRAEADSLLDAAADQGYKPAIKTRECFRECRGK